MTVASTPEAPQTEPYWAKLVRNVSDNTAAISWPRDRFGTTSDFKKEFGRAANNLGGNEEKEEILIATLYVAIAHIKARSAKDRRNKEARLAKIRKAAEDRMPLETFHTYNRTPVKETKNASSEIL